MQVAFVFHCNGRYGKLNFQTFEKWSRDTSWGESSSAKRQGCEGAEKNTPSHSYHVTGPESARSTNLNVHVRIMAHRSVIRTDVTTYQRLDRGIKHSYSHTFSPLAINDLNRSGNYMYHLL
jgi:hypothetical protein